jgi:hypothetical protein
MTPREIRQYASDNFAWDPERGFRYGNAVPALAVALRLLPSTVERALSRRDKRTPKSEGGPADIQVVIRINEQQQRKALKLAKKAGHKTVPGWVKALVEREVGV